MSFHNIKKNADFEYILKYFSSILKFIVPIGLGKTANGSEIKFSEQ